MKIIKGLGIAIGALVTLIVVLGIIAPKEYSVSRSIEISASQEKVMGFITSFEASQSWSPWAEKNPNMKLTFEGEPGKAGHKSSWEGNEDVGKGSQEILSIDGGLIKNKLVFIEPWQSESDVWFDVNEADGLTTVTWGMSGSNPFPWNIMSLFMSMDEMLGKDFEKGLSKMKNIAEKE